MKPKKVLAGLGIFLLGMVLCTLLSRGIYASALPQVTLESAKRNALIHQVRANGNVRQGRELALSIEPGIRVSEILVMEGDSVTAGQPLFSLDLDHVRELMAQNEQEINRQRLSLATLQHNTELAAEQKNEEMLRAGQDFLWDRQQAAILLERAQEDKEQAERELAEIEAERPENGEDDPGYELWENEWKAQLDAVKAARRALEDAQNTVLETETESDRALADALSQEMTDAAMGTGRMELDALYDRQALLQEILDSDGLVWADRDGTVIEMMVSPGEPTPSGCAVLFADAKSPFYFSVLLDAEQKKYVEPGMEVKVTLGGSGADQTLSLTMDYLTELDSAPGTFSGLVKLPEGTGRIGQTGTLEVSVQSEIFPCCVPLEALHQDANQNWFVYVMEERPTMLGTEPVAAKRVVKLLDQNERLAAIEQGAIDGTEQVIVGTTKEFADGDVVRKKE